MPEPLTETDWDELVYLIQEGQCTPFIGAGASYPTLPLGSQLARRWAEEYHYPLDDKSDLARVAQFMAIDRSPIYPKVTIQREFRDVTPPDFDQPDDPHAALADLDLPIYVTTNYDSFMLQALKRRGKDAQREFCRWNRFPEIAGQRSILDGDYIPTRAAPLVYHLHGYTELLQSMVLTESDYLDFLIRFSREQDFLPPAIRTALAGTALLFVGYSLADWNFRVILRGLVSSLPRTLGYPGLAVQLPIEGQSEEQIARTERYVTQYFSEIPQIPVRIFWGNANQFACALRERVLGSQPCEKGGRDA